MNIKQNVVKTWWEVVSELESNPNIVCRIRVQAESEEAARLAAEVDLPKCNIIREIIPADDDFPDIEIPSDAELI